MLVQLVGDVPVLELLCFILIDHRTYIFLHSSQLSFEGLVMFFEEFQRRISVRLFCLHLSEDLFPCLPLLDLIAVLYKQLLMPILLVLQLLLVLLDPLVLLIDRLGLVSSHSLIITCCLLLQLVEGSLPVL